MKRDFDGVMPPVVLIRKLYKRSAKKRAGARAWTLKRVPMQKPTQGAGNSMAGANDDKDFEEFLQVRVCLGLLGGGHGRRGCVCWCCLPQASGLGLLQFWLYHVVSHSCSGVAHGVVA